MGKRGSDSAGSARKRQEQMSEVLLRVLCNGIRRNILRALNGKGAARSPKELTEEIEHGLGNISYHARILAEAGAIELVRTEAVRGSVAHFYASTVSKNPMVLAILSETKKEDQRVKTGPQGPKRKSKKDPKKKRKSRSA